MTAGVAYEVTVTSLTRGWSYVSTQGDTVDPEAPVLLVDPLSFSWAFTDEQIPGQLEPFTGSVNLAARTAVDIPPTQVGDLLTLEVRLDGGPCLIQQTLRIASAEVTLNSPRRSHPVHLTLALVDTSVDWRAKVPVISARTLTDWAGRIADVGARIGLPVGCPDTWDTPEGPPDPTTGPTLGEHVQYPAAQEMLTRLLQSHVPDGDAYAFASTYSEDWPAGYEYIGIHDPATSVDTPPEPPGPVRAVLVPASRRTTSNGLPLVFEVVDGLLTVVATPPLDWVGSSTTQVAIPACWCILPAQARQARDQAVNTLQLEGYANFETGEPLSEDFNVESLEFTYVTSDISDVFVTGSRVRNLLTDLTYAIFAEDGTPYDDGSINQAAYDAIITAFMSDDTARAATWAYDAFTLHTRDMTEAEAENVLPLIAPRLPGEEDGDSRLVRHLTIFGVDDALRLDGGIVSGFVTAGSLDIYDGELTFQLTLAPGRPIHGDITTPVTFSELEAIATTHSLTTEDIHPSVSFADLAYVDN